MNSDPINAVWIKNSARLMGLAGTAALLLGGTHPIAAGLIFPPWDKIAHIAVYAILAILISLASGYNGTKFLLIGFFGAVSIGVADEILQQWSPGRHADLEDLLANTVGAALGILPLSVVVHRQNKACKHDHHLSSD